MDIYTLALIQSLLAPVTLNTIGEVCFKCVFALLILASNAFFFFFWSKRGARLLIYVCLCFYRPNRKQCAAFRLGLKNVAPQCMSAYTALL